MTSVKKSVTHHRKNKVVSKSSARLTVRHTSSGRFVAKSTITSKGQTTVPMEVRSRLKADSGAILKWEAKGSDEFVVKVIRKDVTRLKGIVAKPKKPVSVEDMNNAIGEMASGER